MAQSKLVKTRQMSECPIFGKFSDLREVELPTYEHVMKCYCYIRHNLKIATEKDPTVREICDILVPKIEQIWSRASIPVVSSRRILQMIIDYHAKYRNLLRSKIRKGSEKFDCNLAKFREEAKRLFDIAACKCVNFNTCTCIKEKKVPVMEQEFLKDQRSNRTMVIGNIDIATTSALRRKEERKSKELQRIVKFTQEQTKNTSISETVTGDNDSAEERQCSLPEEANQPGPSNIQEINLPGPSKLKEEKSTQMRIKLASVASIADRIGISDRAAAAIASAALQDLGVITEDDKTNVIDRMKIRRARSKNRRDLINDSRYNQITENRGLFFDGRKDKTIVQEKKGTKLYKKVISEEHVSLIEEPNSKFLGHVTPKSGTGKDIADSILEFLEDREHNKQLLNFTAIGCDGTVVNTGHSNGVISLMEKEIGRPLQWLICLFHGNELPLRHLFCHLDGKTKGPNEFKGEIGQQLENCANLPVVTFLPIENNLPPLGDKNDLSTDQKYLLDMCIAVSSGNVSQDLSLRNPGKLAHSRWLTLASRVLRLYVATENPTENLKTLAEYIVKVYVPVWFNIKLKPSCTYGSKHLFNLISYSRYLSDDLKNVIDPIIQRNGYFAAPENLLLSMLCDERKIQRELGLRRVLKARTERRDGVRKFKVPKINFDAKDYIDMILWPENDVTEPPLLKHVSSDSLKDFIRKASEAQPNSKVDPVVDFPRLPCHTQAVERAVKLVTESAQNVCGSIAREGYIRAKIDSRENMPKFNTKKQFNVSMK
jgi:hypothetical protein